MSKEAVKEVYLGDGLYASYQNGDIILRAPREGGDHWVGLDLDVLENFVLFTKGVLERRRKERQRQRKDIT